MAKNKMFGLCLEEDLRMKLQREANEELSKAEVTERIALLKQRIPAGYFIDYLLPDDERPCDYVEDLKDLKNMLCWIDEKVYQGDLKADENKEEL